MKKKKYKLKYRSAVVLLAKTRKSGGAMRNKKDKRKNGKNSQEEFLDEDY